MAEHEEENDEASLLSRRLVSEHADSEHRASSLNFFTDETAVDDLIWLVINRAIAEVAAGKATTVEITLIEDGGIQISDDGQGRPLDTTDWQRAIEGAYEGSRRPRWEVELLRDGSRWVQHNDIDMPRDFERIGDATATATTVRCWVEARSGPTDPSSQTTFAHRLQALSFFNPRLTLKRLDESQTEMGGAVRWRPRTFHFPNGLADYVSLINRTKTPIQRSVIHFCAEHDGLGIEIAAQWNAGFSPTIHSFANGVRTHQGGAHVHGFLQAVTSAVNKYTIDRFPPGSTPYLSGDEVCEGFAAVISISTPDPWLEHSELLNTEVWAVVREVCEHQLTQWFTANREEAEMIFAKAIRSREQRRGPRTSSCRG